MSTPIRTKTADPLRRVSDPRARRWLRRLLTRGEQASSNAPRRPPPAGRGAK
jgi:hypothetical protein